jgi:hypothetical protein
MKTIQLTRFAYTPIGTFGELIIDGKHFCFVVEEVWHANRPSIPGKQTGSCIPVGNYICRRGHFPRHGNTFEVLNVPGRSAILFHSGNTVEDIEGCLALGNRLGYLKGKWAVMESAGIDGGYTRFMLELSNGSEFELKIVNRIGGILL